MFLIVKQKAVNGLETNTHRPKLPSRARGKKKTRKYKKKEREHSVLWTSRVLPSQGSLMRHDN